MTFDPLNFQVVCPVFGRAWNAQQHIQSLGSIDVPYLLIDNSPDSFVKTLNVPSGIEVEFHPENIGTSQAWNKAIRRGRKWTLILSVSTRFDEKGLNGYLEEAQYFANDIMMTSVRNGHAFIVGQELVRKIGYYDENLLVYLEDTDWSRRMYLHPQIGKSARPSLYYPGCWFIGDAVALRSSGLKLDGDKLMGYYKSKWSEEHPHETFTTPFGDPNNPLSFFPGCEKL